MARRDTAGVRLYTRNGHDFAARFPLIVAAVATLPAHSCLIDGEVLSTTITRVANGKSHLILSSD
jgi:bifunctional non-homologous end joining protein LigD